MSVNLAGPDSLLSIHRGVSKVVRTVVPQPNWPIEDSRDSLVEQYNRHVRSCIPEVFQNVPSKHLFEGFWQPQQRARRRTASNFVCLTN